MKEKNNEEKICWGCQRFIVGKSTLGLCPKCVQRYGSPAAAIGIIGGGVAGKFMLKKGWKVVKTAFNAAKNLKG